MSSLFSTVDNGTYARNMGPTFKAARPANAVWSPWSSNQRQSASSMEQSNGIVRETRLINETQQHTEKNDERPGYRPVKFSPVAHLTQANKPQSHDAVSSPTTPPSPSAALRTSWNPVVSELKEQYQPAEGAPSTKPAASKPLPPPPVPPSPASPTLGPASSPPATANGSDSPTSSFAKLRVGGSGLPPSQSPTITLLQKAREGQIPKGALYIDHNFDSKEVPAPRRFGRPNEPYVYDERVTLDGDRVHTDTYYAMPTSKEVSTGVQTTIKAPPKYEGIGPTINGIPVALRTDMGFQNVKDEYASDWYKTMYKRLHKYGDGDYMTVGYRKRGNRHNDGYMSEPEFSSRNDDRPMFGGRNAKRAVSRGYANGLSTSPASYKIQPRSIAEYEPGHSSIAEREAAFSSRYMPPLDAPKPKYTLSDGYESDTTLIRKAGRRMNHLDSKQQREWYKAVQRGEDIPLEGLGKPAPEKPRGERTTPFPFFSRYSPIPSRRERHIAGFSVPPLTSSLHGAECECCISVRLRPASSPVERKFKPNVDAAVMSSLCPAMATDMRHRNFSTTALLFRGLPRALWWREGAQVAFVAFEWDRLIASRLHLVGTVATKVSQSLVERAEKI